MNIDEYNFDELSKFVKFVKIFPRQNFMLYGSVFKGARGFLKLFKHLSC